MTAPMAGQPVVTRAEVEDFLYHEAALLDEWRLAEWQELLTEDAAYYVPPNDRIIRVLDPNCHAEFPHSRTRRLISNVRIVAREGDLVTVASNFVCYRYRRYERIREYVGAYRHVLKRTGDSFRIKERRVIIDAHELGALGSVSFIL